MFVKTSMGVWLACVFQSALRVTVRLLVANLHDFMWRAKLGSDKLSNFVTDNKHITKQVFTIAFMLSES